MMTAERNDRGPDGGPVRRWLFTVDVDPPSLLHLAGELDIAGAATLVAALQPLTRRGGTIRLNLADLRFVDASGIRVFCQAAHELGKRGRIVLHDSPPSVQRVVGLAGIAGVVVDLSRT
jgi:anti-anti-sigma factor